MTSFSDPYLRYVGDPQNEAYDLYSGPHCLVRLEVIGAHFQWLAIDSRPSTCYQLSRFAYLHAVEGQFLLESSLGQAQIFLEDPRVLVLIYTLVRETCSVEKLFEKLPALSLSEHQNVLFFLNSMGALEHTPQNAELAHWEFHDLLFHTRSRAGRHHHRIGISHRFQIEGNLPPTPKTTMTATFLELALPETQKFEKDPPFQKVMAARHSSHHNPSLLTLEELSEFLYRSKHYPSAGGLYELELYITVYNCQHLPSGLYHYDAQHHRLAFLSSIPLPAAQKFPEKFSVLITLAAQFEKVSWKYDSIAYALILKNVGVLYQTFYLAATAMNLACCALGVGNSDDFSDFSGLNYYQEGSVGEFYVGGKKN